MATMKDVANLAGVSTATLSRVINRTSYVEPVTQERVEEVARANGCQLVVIIGGHNTQQEKEKLFRKRWSSWYLSFINK